MLASSSAPVPLVGAHLAIPAVPLSTPLSMKLGLTCQTCRSPFPCGWCRVLTTESPSPGSASPKNPHLSDIYSGARPGYFRIILRAIRIVIESWGSLRLSALPPTSPHLIALTQPLRHSKHYSTPPLLDKMAGWGYAFSLSKEQLAEAEPPGTVRLVGKDSVERKRCPRR